MPRCQLGSVTWFGVMPKTRRGASLQVARRETIERLAENPLLQMFQMADETGEYVHVYGAQEIDVSQPTGRMQLDHSLRKVMLRGNTQVTVEPDQEIGVTPGHGIIATGGSYVHSLLTGQLTRVVSPVRLLPLATVPQDSRPPMFFGLLWAQDEAHGFYNADGQLIAHGQEVEDGLMGIVPRVMKAEPLEGITYDASLPVRWDKALPLNHAAAVLKGFRLGFEVQPVLDGDQMKAEELPDQLIALRQVVMSGK